MLSSMKYSTQKLTQPVLTDQPGHTRVLNIVFSSSFLLPSVIVFINLFNLSFFLFSVLILLYITNNLKFTISQQSVGWSRHQGKLTRIMERKKSKASKIVMNDDDDNFIICKIIIITSHNYYLPDVHSVSLAGKKTWECSSFIVQPTLRCTTTAVNVGWRIGKK